MDHAEGGSSHEVGHIQSNCLQILVIVEVKVDPHITIQKRITNWLTSTIHALNWMVNDTFYFPYRTFNRIACAQAEWSFIITT